MHRLKMPLEKREEKRAWQFWKWIVIKTICKMKPHQNERCQQRTPFLNPTFRSPNFSLFAFGLRYGDTDLFLFWEILKQFLHSMSKNKGWIGSNWDCSNSGQMSLVYLACKNWPATFLVNSNQMNTLQKKIKPWVYSQTVT